MSPLFRRLLAGAPALLLCAAAAAATPERTVGHEVIIGHPRAKVAEFGYTAPEVFNPVTDRIYQGGFRYGGPPVEIPREVRYLTAMGRVNFMKRIIACTDAWYYPFAETAPKGQPPGIDIEILASIAKRNGYEYSIMWANTGVYRGGFKKAFRETIDKGFCDVFLGMIQTGDDDHMTLHSMAFSRPYLGLGFVLVTNGKVPKVRALEELKGKGFRIGVPAYTPMQASAEALGIAVTTYFKNDRVIDGLLRGEVDAVMVWGPAIAVANRTRNVELAMSEGFVPGPGQRFNASWGIKAKEDGFREFIDRELGAMVASGEIRRIVEKYGVPYFDPFPDAPSMSGSQ